MRKFRGINLPQKYILSTYPTVISKMNKNGAEVINFAKGYMKLAADRNFWTYAKKYTINTNTKRWNFNGFGNFIYIQ